MYVATVLHESDNRFSVMYRFLDDVGREVHQFLAIRIPCRSYKHAQAVAKTLNATDSS